MLDETRGNAGVDARTAARAEGGEDLLEPCEIALPGVLYDLQTRTTQLVPGVSACDVLLLSADGQTLRAGRRLHDGDV